MLEVTGIDSASGLRTWLAANDQIASFRIWPRVSHRYTLDMLGQENLELRIDRSSALEVVWLAPTFEPSDDETLREAIADLGGPFTKVVVKPPAKMTRASRGLVVASVRAATTREPEVS